MSNWQLTVGMEVHVELETKTKMFCSCKNDPFNSEPNSNVCPVCYGLPGVLPLLNKEAVSLTVKLGQALGGQIPSETFWARKNYFYPDLPKGYQISQSSAPLVEKAVVTIDGQQHRIQRIHLEEDAGKLQHAGDKSHSLVDYNRAGVPLIELVTEPDFHSAESAKRFCQELQRIMRSLKISSADMEKGQMRCEANISVSKSSELGTKVEVKNINSFRSVEKAILFEFDRQTKALETGQQLVQETRTWNDIAGQTVPMRSKETSADYRYFPEPDLPVVILSTNQLSDHLLPDQQRQQLAELGLPKELIQPVIDKGGFERVVELAAEDKLLAQMAAKTLIAVPEFLSMSAEEQGELLQLKTERGYTNEAIKAIVLQVVGGQTLEQAAGPTTDLNLESIIAEIIAANQALVTSYQNGNHNVLNALIGQVMAKSQGRANVVQVRQLLETALAN